MQFATRIWLAALMAFVCGCSQEGAPVAVSTVPKSPNAGESGTQMPRANPAAELCIAEGGRAVIERTSRGDEIGVCVFEENRQCEEWALMRGDCPVGGRRITGYATAAARYCAITGGTYQDTVQETAEREEQGTCTFGEKVCDVHAYFRGDCSRS